ncbi:MAG: hypothetical protein JNK30_00305 [Phenylobacterium sp.]|uniref:hypothetical protein n=1 Tax=Phenylobacterium sp. TaxID=1871053 RepID=UPI001A3A040B|nr:hypothetical protein [Phenylobacterium sp.]MBL8769794.1 hypothetical protein [Phenylobacterium sp.]
MTTIRPNILPPSHQGPQPQDRDRMAAQRAFFAQAMGQAQAAAAPAPSPVSAPVSAPVSSGATVAAARTAASPSSAEAPQKILRPGSLVDIRV